MKGNHALKIFPGVLISLTLGLSLFSCGKGASYNLPSGYESMSDSAKVAWMMEKYPADSVAHFLCRDAASLDSVFKIKDFSQAVVMVYTRYDEENKTKFGTELNEFCGSLPPKYKMRIYYKGSGGAGRRLGYSMAEDYLKSDSREINSELKADYEALKEICPDDRKFIKEFYEGAESAFRQKGKPFVLN